MERAGTIQGAVTQERTCSDVRKREGGFQGEVTHLRSDSSAREGGKRDAKGGSRGGPTRSGKWPGFSACLLFAATCECQGGLGIFKQWSLGDTHSHSLTPYSLTPLSLTPENATLKQ
eukprot:1161298-Pelagomonas_calceolata.AAC.16